MVFGTVWFSNTNNALELCSIYVDSFKTEVKVSNPSENVKLVEGFKVTDRSPTFDTVIEKFVSNPA